MDDMVQDTVDALTWVHKNIFSFGGDKVRAILKLLFIASSMLQSLCEQLVDLCVFF